MKGIYIAPVDRASSRFRGVYKKIESQINAFKNLGVEMDSIMVDNNEIIINEKKENIFLNRAKHYVFFKYILSNIDFIIKKYEFVYIRYSFANPFMFYIAEKLTKAGIKVLIEIPTYPYENEIPNSFKNIILKKIDRILWENKGKWVYRIVLTTDKKELFGIKAINIFNGINSSDITLVEKNTEKEKINIIGVANISRWHGYDRIIKGISKYNNCNKKIKDVSFYIIGEGPEKKNLEELAIKLGVEKSVFFLGAKFGNELDELYKAMHIGVSSLALFRAGGGHDPIKSKEYVAKGMPVVIGYKDRALSSNLPFVFQVPADESYVNINEIIEKYMKIDTHGEEIVKFALDNLTWEQQIKKVISTL